MTDVFEYADNHLGVYIPRHFARTIDRRQCHGVDPHHWSWDVVFHGPDHPEYWEGWQHLLDNITVRLGRKTYHLHHDMDLWLVANNRKGRQWLKRTRA